MELKEFTESLQNSLSKESHILTDENGPEFKQALSRWSNIDLKTPGAIIQPASEADTITTAQAALKASIPFVPATGGHSPWSTLPAPGIILDLSLYKSATVDPANSSVTIAGGLLMKDLQVALHPHNQFTAVSNGSTVGCIPFFLNGGLSTYYPLIGHACESILAATLLTATGDLVTATEATHPDLLWALRGAGQFFGLVLSLTIRTFPGSLLPNPAGPLTLSRHAHTYFFPTSALPALLPTLHSILSPPTPSPNNIKLWGQLTLATSPFPPHAPTLLLTLHSFSPTPLTDEALAPLLALAPLKHIYTTPTFEAHSDHLDWTCAHGDYKRYLQIGLPAPSAPLDTAATKEDALPHPFTNFPTLLPLHASLLATHPSAGKSVLTLTFSTPRLPPSPHSEPQTQPIATSFGHPHLTTWFAVLTWDTDPASDEAMAEFSREAMVVMRRGETEKGTAGKSERKEGEEEGEGKGDGGEGGYVSYTNNTRADPLEWRYKGEERVGRLRGLKGVWDPKGVFGGVL